MTTSSFTVFDFQRRFRTERACWKHLYRSRWPKGFVCPQCRSKRGSFITTRSLVQCLRCRYQASLTAGTVMHRTRIPLRVWFWGAYLVSTQAAGISALQFQKQVGLGRYETAFNMLHKLRAGLLQKDGPKLSGTVEVDETFVGGRAPGPPGRGARGKSVVVGAVEVRQGTKRPYSGKIKLRVIPDASGKSLVKFIKDRIEPDSVIVTDEWRGYAPLARADYRHRPTQSLDDLVHIHRVFANLKAWLKGTHHYVSAKHLQAYLNEFSYRTNGRWDRSVAFERLLGIASHGKAPTYRKLYDAGNRRKRGWVHPNVPELLAKG